MDVLEETYKDLLLGVETAPVLDRAQVIGEQSRTVALEVPVESFVGYGLQGARAAEVHQRLRPGALYGVAHHKYDLSLGHELVDVGYHPPVQDRVIRRRLAGDHPPALLEQGGVPLVTGSHQKVPQVPRQAPRGASPLVPPELAFDLSTPALVGRPLAEEFVLDGGFDPDLLVEVVELFLFWHPDAGVGLEVAVQPRGARLLRPYYDEVRESLRALGRPEVELPGPAFHRKA